jgi:beta-glucosidase
MRNINRLLGALLLPNAVFAQYSSNASSNSGNQGLLSSGNVEMGAWAEAYAKAVALVTQLTNQEKVTIITGGSVSSVNWTALEFKDGTQGVQGKYILSPVIPI